MQRGRFVLTWVLVWLSLCAAEAPLRSVEVAIVTTANNLAPLDKWYVLLDGLPDVYGRTPYMEMRNSWIGEPAGDWGERFASRLGVPPVTIPAWGSKPERRGYYLARKEHPHAGLLITVAPWSGVSVWCDDYPMPSGLGFTAPAADRVVEQWLAALSR